MYCTIVLNRSQGNFYLETNISYEDIKDFVIGWIKSDIHERKDYRELKSKPEYWISIYKDKNGYQVDDNCQNRDLRRGILGLFIKEYKNIRKQKERENK